MLSKKHTLATLAGIALGWMTLTTGVESFLIETAHAQTTTPTQTVWSTITTVAAMLATVMEFLSFIIFHYLQFLLDPHFILGITRDTNGGGEQVLNNIWQFSRDLMNIIFAFLLIALGIVTVVTADSQYVTSYFKKFIIAVILVNFSWWFPRVILDVANVLTATVYQLPGTVPGATDCVYRVNDVEEPCKIITDVKFFKACDKPEYASYISKALNTVCYDSENLATDSNTAMGMLNGLVVNYGRLGELTRILNPSAGPGGGSRISDYFFFVIHVMFVLVLMAMLFLPLVAMFVVFLIRIPIMWLTIAFMPFMFLGFVIGDKMGQFNTFKIFDHYVKAAFLPTAVAIPLTVGFILLNSISGNCPAVAATLCEDTGPLIHGVHDLWTLLWLIMSFVVIWSGFFFALQIDSIYSKAASGIQSFGQSIGSAAIKAPLSLPIIPIPKGADTLDGNADGATSLLSLSRAPRRLSNKFSNGGSALDIGGKKTGGDTGSKKIADVLNNPKSTTNQLLERLINSNMSSFDRNSSGSLNRSELQDLIDAQLSNPNSELKKHFDSEKINGNSGEVTDSILSNLENFSDDLKNKLDK